MAEQVPEFQTLREKRSGKPKYPWAEWLNGEPWILEAAVDYNCQAVSFVSSAAKYAARNGFSVKTSISEDGMMVSLQAIEKRKKGKA